MNPIQRVRFKFEKNRVNFNAVIDRPESDKEEARAKYQVIQNKKDIIDKMTL